MKQVELPDDVTSRDLEKRLKAAIDETLDGEWVFAIQSLSFVQHDGDTNTVLFDVVFVAVPGAGPTADTTPKGLPDEIQYRPGKFDSP
ncbi:hypothetical protein BN000_01479 [Mycobacterium europaeum]|uniref:Uncharacterized protein n=1 Tax=Mycobacterium europaeum TaxID=761804 RepID=A0A0U1D6K6_9MYCO|nr:hypothetical protein [Mycobacterium europaeum]CQD07406.1 hypothetical protein BN000_01479 [Mycobacterium europaeum]